MCLIHKWLPGESPPTAPAQTSQIFLPYPNSSGSFMILFLFTALAQLQKHSYNVMSGTQTWESWNMEEVVGGAWPAPAAHQHSGLQLFPEASLEFSLAEEKATDTAFVLKFHLTTVTCLCSFAQILTCALNTLVKQLKLNIYFAGVPLFALFLLLPSVRLPHWSFLERKHQ